MMENEKFKNITVEKVQNLSAVELVEFRDYCNTRPPEERTRLLAMTNPEYMFLNQRSDSSQ